MILRLLVLATLLGGASGCGDDSSAGGGSTAGAAASGGEGGGGGGVAGAVGSGGEGGDGQGGGPENLCLHPTPVVCAPRDSCHVATCDPLTGTCSESMKPDGALCSDGDSCSFGETCIAGACGVGEPLECTGGASCALGVCEAPMCSGVMGAPWAIQVPGTGVIGPLLTQDLNGDSNPDLVTAGNGALHIFFALGGGFFSPPQAYAFPLTPAAVAMADVDGDADADLLATTLGVDTLTVLLNDGAGTFTLAATYGTGATPSAIATADLSGDTLPDLAVANLSGDSVSVYINQGGGTFSAQAVYPVGESPRSLVAADLTGDGLTDLAVASSGSETLGLLENQGAAIFAPVQNQMFPEIPQQLAAADFDADGAIDLVMSAHLGFTAYTVFLSNGGDGSFTAAATLIGGDSYSPPAIADFDSDGLPDVAFGSDLNEKTVLLNQGAFLFDSQDYGFIGAIGQVATADFDQDGTTDLAFTDSEIVNFWFNDGAGAMADPGRYALSDESEQSAPGHITSGDLDNDGDDDLIICASNQPPRVFLREADGLLAPSFDTELWSGDVRAVDLDADGDLDLVGISSDTLEVLYNQGGALFGDLTVYPAGGEVGDLATPDVNGDGALDIVTTHLTSDTVSVLLNTGSGAFASPQSYPAGGVYPAHIVSADFDADGDPDLALAGAESFVSVLSNQGGGVFGGAVSYAGTNAMTVATGDFDGDGAVDLAVPMSNAYLRIFFNSGAGVFSPGVDYPLPDDLVGVGIVATDMNADGATDLLLTGLTNAYVYQLLNAGNGGFGPAQRYFIGSEVKGVVAVDLDLNGLLDIAGISQWGQTGELRVWLRACGP